MKRKDIKAKKEIEEFMGANPEYNGLLYEAIDDDDVEQAVHMTIQMIMGLSSDATAKICWFFNKVSDAIDDVYYESDGSTEFEKKIDEVREKYREFDNEEDGE